MKYVVSESGTVHDVVELDHRESHAVAECGYAGAPVELDPDEIEDADRCGSCYELDEEDVEDEDEHDGE